MNKVSLISIISLCITISSTFAIEPAKVKPMGFGGYLIIASDLSVNVLIDTKGVPSKVQYISSINNPQITFRTFMYDKNIILDLEHSEIMGEVVMAKLFYNSEEVIEKDLLLKMIVAMTDNKNISQNFIDSLSE